MQDFVHQPYLKPEWGILGGSGDRTRSARTPPARILWAVGFGIHRVLGLGFRDATANNGYRRINQV